MSIRPEQAAPASDPDDGLGVTADARARLAETLSLAARHLDPSLVDVLRILGFDKEYALGARAPTSTTRPAAPTSTSTPARASPASATTTPTCATCCRRRSPPTSSTACRSTTRRSPGCSPRRSRSACRAALDAVFFASTGAEAVDSAMKFARAATGRPRLLSCEQQLPRRHARPALARRRRVLQGGLRAAAARLRARAVRRPRRGSRRSCARRTSPRSSSSRSRAAMVTLPPAGYLQAAQELCRRYGTLFVARRDPDRARAHGQVVRARALGPRARLRARRQGAQRRLHAGRGDGHHAARSTSAPSARSSAATCTSRPTAATACRWPPASPRCGSSSATASSSTPRGSARCCATACSSCSSATR